MNFDDAYKEMLNGKMCEKKITNERRIKYE